MYLEQYSELYRTLVKTDTSRRLIATDLYSKNIVSQREHDKIKEIEKLHGADESTDEILKRIETHLSIFPTNIGKVLEVLGREEVLVPIVTSMKTKLSPLASGPAVCSETVLPQSGASAMTSPVASLQSLVSIGGQKGMCYINDNL